MKLDVLAFGAHPDDTELHCSGTLAALVQQGKSVGVVDLTRGEMGTRGTPEGRLKEAEEAARILGLKARVNLGLPDTLLDNTRSHQLRIIEQLRKFQPSVCIITSPEDRHPDHGKATQLLKDAIFYSGLIKIETFEHGIPQAPWRPNHVIHYVQDTLLSPDFIFDISSTIEIKKKAILAFKSQFNVEGDTSEPQTYISSPAFFEAMEARARFFGQQIGVTYGEPFIYGNPVMGFKNFAPFFDHAPKR
jgi:bacillithiol biosynthesis deacetylase BshB1